MSIYASEGPLIVYGRARPSGGIGMAQDYNPDDPSPSFGMRGFGLMDARPQFCYQPGQSETRPFYNYAPGGVLIDQVPATAAVNNIAASTVPVAGTPFPLVTTTGAGVTVGASVVNALTGQLVTGLLALDGPAGAVAFGSNGSANIWDPTKSLSRAVRIVSAGNDSTATFLISGYDIYGFPMTQLLTGASGAPGTATTLKAFKYIASILPAGTLSGSAITVGTTDVVGLPLAAPLFGYLTIYFNNTLITASTGFVAPVTTSPATNLTGDVRGTYLLQGGSDGTKALQLFWRPNVAGLLTQAGVWGVNQI